MRSPHFAGLDTAFLQLSFALKVWNYLREHPIPKDDFDIALTVEDACGRVCLSHNEFDGSDHVIVAAENNIAICFGAAAITLCEAMREHAGLSSSRMNPAGSKQDMLAGLTYMIRCCFAHGTAEPRWRIENPKYQVEYRVGNKYIDLRAVDGQVFDYATNGGFETLWLIQAEARALGML
jgi:hypothetical protein